MRKSIGRRRGLILAAGAALTLGAAPAPATAAIETDHCLERPYVQHAAYCACLVVATVSNMVFPDTWSCLEP